MSRGIVTFPVNGSSSNGYLSLPSGTGPGVVVIQEWWGLVDHIKEVCDRLAEEGFVALAPDLYHGVTTYQPNEAEKLSMRLRLEEAAGDLAAASDHLRHHDRVEPRRVGAIGFCLGGALSFVLAAREPVDAVVAFYGLPNLDTDLSQLAAPIQGHFAEFDEWANPARAGGLFRELRRRGVEAELHTYAGTHHGFFNDTYDLHSPEAAALAWERSISFLRRMLWLTP